MGCWRATLTPAPPPGCSGRWRRTGTRVWLWPRHTPFPTSGGRVGRARREASRCGGRLQGGLGRSIELAQAAPCRFASRRWCTRSRRISRDLSACCAYTLPRPLQQAGRGGPRRTRRGGGAARTARRVSLRPRPPGQPRLFGEAGGPAGPAAAAPARPEPRDDGRVRQRARRTARGTAAGGWLLPSIAQFLPWQQRLQRLRRQSKLDLLVPGASRLGVVPSFILFATQALSSWRRQHGRQPLLVQLADDMIAHAAPACRPRMQQHFPISPCHPAPFIQKQVQTPIALLALCISQAAPVPLTSSLLYLPPQVCRFNVSTPAPSMHTCFQSTQALAVQHTTPPRLCRCQFVPTPFAACPPLRCSQPGWAAASVAGDARAHAKGWFQARGE